MALEARRGLTGRSPRGVGSVLELLWVLRVTSTPLWSPAVIALMSTVAGLAEATALVMIISLVTGTQTAEGELATALGLSDQSAVSTGLVGVFLVLISLGSNLITSLLVARSAAHGVDVVRRAFADSFLLATFSSRERLTAARSAELMGLGAYQAETALLQGAAVVIAVVSLLAYLGIAVLLEPLAALAAVVLGLAMMTLLRPVARAAQRRMRVYVDRSAEALAWFGQMVDLAVEARSFGVEKPALEEFASRSARAARAGRRARFLLSLSPALYQTTALILVLIGAVAATKSALVAPSALAVIAVLLIRALSLVQRLALALQSLGAALPLLQDVLGVTNSLREDPQTRGSSVLSSARVISVRDLTFGYDLQRPVLQGVSFDVSMGELVAFIGPSGGGKSTLFELLLRLRRPDEGSICLDGVDLSDVADESLRRLLAYVPQDNRLLHDSLHANTSFLRDIDDAAIVAALAGAGLHNVSEGSLLRGDLTTATVSGGQRQRIGIARATATKPSFILLDEPTSGLDHDNERIVRRTLESLRAHSAVLLIAHRASTVAMCDRVIVLQGGKVLDDGPRSQVLARNVYLQEMLLDDRAP